MRLTRVTGMAYTKPMSTNEAAERLEDGSTWRALEQAMRRYLDGDRDWLKVQEALYQRDRYHALSTSAGAAPLDVERLRETVSGLIALLDEPALIDVERLARALHKSKIAGYHSVDFCEGDGWDEVDHIGDAEAIAAEYARLASEGTDR